MASHRFICSSIFICFFAFAGFSQYAEYEWEDRDKWMDVSKIFNLADIQEGHKVADIGCHEGFLSVRLSKRVGDSGEVFAVDVRTDRLENLRENLEYRSINNVEIILGDYDNPKLPMEELDAVILMDTYHEIADYMKVLGHIHSSLRPGGRLLVLEKLKDKAKDKNRSVQTDAHTIASKYVKKELLQAGFEITESISDFGKWEREESKTMWILVARKSMN